MSMPPATDFGSKISARAGRGSFGLKGHPRGLSTLFMTELWERFSYYGMRALLTLFMVAPIANGGLGFTTVDAARFYGNYTMAIYMLAIPGGFIADHFLGARRAVLIGGIIIACGHLSLAIPSLGSFYVGLILIALGSGLLKPNISAMVGALYAPDDTRLAPVDPSTGIDHRLCVGIGRERQPHEAKQEECGGQFHAGSLLSATKALCEGQDRSNRRMAHRFYRRLCIAARSSARAAH